LPVYAKISVDRNPPAIIDVIFQNLSRKAGAESEKNIRNQLFVDRYVLRPRFTLRGHQQIQCGRSVSLDPFLAANHCARVLFFFILSNIIYYSFLSSKRGAALFCSAPRIFLRITE